MSEAPREIWVFGNEVFTSEPDGFRTGCAVKFTRSDLSEHQEDGLRQIVRWSEAYPASIFPEPDDAYYQKAHEVLTANGMTLDRLSAAAIRHVIAEVGKIARRALGND